MKVLQVHNYYQQPGGEDQVVAAEAQLLEQHGNSVEQFTIHNDELKNMPALKMARYTIWNRDSYRRLAGAIDRCRPDVVHCHNTFPLASPAVYYAAAHMRVPVVQTVHNYRLICPTATLFRDGHVCEDCVCKAIPYPGVLHACYRQSRFASAAVASLLAAHRALGTWRNKVQTYIALTQFIKNKLVQGGFSPDQIAVKPNFLSSDPGPGAGDGAYALFVGRFAPEKGLATLLRAWQYIPELPLKIAGDGPLKHSLIEKSRALPNVTVLGFQPRAQILDLMKRAVFLVVPSEWYEGFPMTVVEAMACGTPVVVSNIGSLQEIAAAQIGGISFPSGDSVALAGAVKNLLQSPVRLKSLRSGARRCFLDLYSADGNYRQLIAIYEKAMATRQLSIST